MTSMTPRHSPGRYAGLPAAARLAWWGTAWLRREVSADDALDAVMAEDVAHVVVGEAVGPVLFLAGLRETGANAVAASFPAPGDPVGLRGPAALNTAAIEAGEVALVLGADTALVPGLVGRAVEWARHPAERRPPPDLGDADRTLRAAVLSVARDLAALDVARWRPQVADELIDLRASEPLRPPPGIPARCVDLAGRALHLWHVVDLAAEDDGAAVSAAEIARRREALLPLDRAVRRAMTAAFSPDAWPPR